ncbi:MAG: ATP-binding protein [Allobranchiibius sp.]
MAGNLIDNAIDASAGSTNPKQVTVTVRIKAEELRIQVDDSGPGLTFDQIEPAFTRGWSTKEATTVAGRGLGLALVTQVVQRYSGTIDVRQAPGGGARFVVTIPLREEALTTS